MKMTTEVPVLVRIEDKCIGTKMYQISILSRYQSATQISPHMI